MNQAKVLGLRESKLQPKIVKVNRSISAIEKKPSKIQKKRLSSNSSADTILVATVKPRMNPRISEVSVDKLQIQPLKRQASKKTENISTNILTPKKQKAFDVTSVTVNKTGVRASRSGLHPRIAKKGLTLDTEKGIKSKLIVKQRSSLKYFWAFMAIDKLVYGAMIIYLIYYIRILLEELRLDRERNMSWWKWMLKKFFDKLGGWEIIGFVLVILISKVCLKGLDILMKNLEFLHEEKTQGDKLLFQERMKKLKNKFKTEKWKTVSEGLTNLLSNIVSTVVNAFVPTDAAARILISVVDTADRKFNRKARKSLSSGYNSDLKLDNLNKINTENINTSKNKPTTSTNPYYANNNSYKDRVKEIENKLKKSPISNNLSGNNTTVKAAIDFEI